MLIDITPTWNKFVNGTLWSISCAIATAVLATMSDEEYHAYLNEYSDIN